jgi:hypothetical protein
VLTTPCAKPVASTATKARRRPFLRVPRIRRTVWSAARSTVGSSKRWRKRYRVVKSGTLTNPQHLAQLAVFAQPHFGFAKGAILITHQAKDRQQLRPCELAVAETTSITRENRSADLQGDASKRQEPDFGHHLFCLGSRQHFQRADDLEFPWS